MRPKLHLLDSNKNCSHEVVNARIEIEFGDGTVQIWTDEEALEYIKVAESAVSYASVNRSIVLPQPTRTFEK